MGAENLGPTGIRSPDPPARKRISIPTELSRPNNGYMTDCWFLKKKSALYGSCLSSSLFIDVFVRGSLPVQQNQQPLTRSNCSLVAACWSATAPLRPGVSPCSATEWSSLSLRYLKQPQLLKRKHSDSSKIVNLTDTRIYIYSCSLNQQSAG